MLWSSFVGKKKVGSLGHTHVLITHCILQSEERLPMRFSKLVEHVSKKPVPPHTKHFVVEVMVMDEEGEDVEVSRVLPVRYRVEADAIDQVPFIVVRI